MDDHLKLFRQIHFYTSTISVLVPLVFGLLRFKKPEKGLWPFAERRRLDRGMTLLFFYVLVAFLVEISSSYLVYFKIPNFWLFSFFTPFEYLLFILIFASWQKNSGVRKAMYASIPLFLVLWSVLTFYLKMDYVDEVILPLNSVIFVALSVQTLFQVNRDSLGTIFSHSQFWFASAVLIYFAGNLMLFILRPKLMDPKSTLIVVWYIHSFLNLTHNLFFAKAFACQNRSIPYGSS